ncbi:testis-specific gene 10 protein isoform X1 [Polypterus senegalus]|uniref:testis-specific gene 10 protein isoform X1 n=2 Tax=Polypterus senegalus TaxID=55291 RepID=UPI001964407A|nr:testis-specific gene 10 protein isoform X1 [Polypterus senegalus]
MESSINQAMTEKKENKDNGANKIKEPNESGSLSLKLDKVKEELKAKTDENENLHSLLEQLQVEKERLAEKIEKNRASEKENILGFGKNKAPKKAGSPSRLDSFIKSLEEDRDYYKNQLEGLRKMLRNRNSRSLRSKSWGRSPSRTPALKGGTSESEIIQLLRERDDLQAMLEKYERHLVEVQANVKVLTAERDKTNMLYGQAQEEIARLRREIIKSPKSPKTSLTAQAILRRVEAERDEAAADLRRMSTERDSLRERIMITQEKAINDKAHLEQKIEDLQADIQMLEKERLDYKAEQGKMKELIFSLEEESKIFSRKATTIEEELNRTKANYNSLRTATNHVEDTLSDTQRHLSQKIAELQGTQEKLKQLDEKNDELARQAINLREDILSLQATVNRLNVDKDTLQSVVDEKTEKISFLEDVITDKDINVKSLNETIGAMESASQNLKDTINNQEREINSLRRQLDSANEELARIGRAREAAAKESFQCREELTKAKLENQTLQRKSQEYCEEIESLKLKVQDHKAETGRIDSQLSYKVIENRELLDKYCQVLAQVESLENKARQTEVQTSSLCSELRAEESERRRLNDRIEQLERELEESLSAEQASKNQISQLTITIRKMEEELRLTQSEKSAVLSDLGCTRELCVKLDTNKDLLNRQLNTKSQEMERVLKELEMAHSEAELLRKQLASERVSLKNLEILLTSNKEKELDNQVYSKEKQSEIDILRENLIKAESKIASQSREVTQAKTKAAQLEVELDMTKRQLSTEQFERQVEQAILELRRHGLTSTLLTTSTPSRRSLSPRSSRSPERSQWRSQGLENQFDRTGSFRDL